MSWRRLHSRSGVPTAPRKYFVVTMLAELTLQKSGNSTPRCSKLTDPSRQFVITTSRRSQVTSSYGWTPSVVHTRSTRRPLPVVVRPLSLAPLEPDDVPTAPVISSPLRRATSPPPQCRTRALPAPDGRSTCGRRAGRRRRGPGVPAGPQGGDLPLEVRQRLERAVHAGEAHVVARHLRGALGPDRLLDPLGQQRDGVVVDRPPLAGLTDACNDLVAAERLGDPAALDDRENRLLDRGEPLATPRACPAAADQLAVVGLPGVDHPRVGVAAVRAPHRPTSPRFAGAPTEAGRSPRRCGGVRAVEKPSPTCG